MTRWTGNYGDFVRQKEEATALAAELDVLKTTRGRREAEQAQAQRMARAAKTAGIEHAIWSTLEDTRRFIPLDDDRMPTLMGQYKVPHFDAKGSANHFFTDAGVPTTFLQTAFYWDNMIGFGSGPQRGEDGSLMLVFPMGEARLSGMAADCVVAVEWLDTDATADEITATWLGKLDIKGCEALVK